MLESAVGFSKVMKRGETSKGCIKSQGNWSMEGEGAFEVAAMGSGLQTDEHDVEGH